MEIPDYQPPNDAVGFLLVLGIAVSAVWLMKYVVESWGAIGEVLIIPILVGALALLTYISPGRVPARYAIATRNEFAISNNSPGHPTSEDDWIRDAIAFHGRGVCMIW